MTHEQKLIEEFLDRKGFSGNERETHADALRQALAQFDSLAEMVEALETERNREEGDEDSARESIEQDPLDVSVRSGWYNPWSADKRDRAPEEFRLLLCTGGPAVQIVGELTEHGEPEKPRLQYQGWFIGWQDVPWHLLPEKAEETLETYCGCFYFGEG